MLRNGTHIDPRNAQLPTGGDPVPASAVKRWSVEMVDRVALLQVLPGPNEVRYATGAAPPPGAATLPDRTVPTDGD
jgi:hypothetical protein